ncbi:MAG: NADPH-dependent stearoyl-CoA 9-desaturase, partial [Frankiales bacterium]|nr:NADPH-dependent stearoyl-CoA 9-desaturase [Frankiales bacterium]
MAIKDAATFAHLTEADMQALGDELDSIRREIESSRGEDDAAYIRRLIAFQRKLAVASRVTLMASSFPPAWVAGTLMLATAKILENMEIGHNVMHGQWDWMNDPEIHSSTWEWDTMCSADAWKHSHNFVHHTYTNVIGKDSDVCYNILRVTPEQKWHPVNLGQPVYNALLALFFEWGVALHDLDLRAIRKGEKDPKELKAQLRTMGRKMRKQVGKDYVLFPLLSGPQFVSTLTANATANLIRNLWSYLIIFCGHFPDGAEKFEEEQLEGETKPEWYLRQLLGSANFHGSRLVHILSGSLGFQIEHHL